MSGCNKITAMRTFQSLVKLFLFINVFITHFWVIPQLIFFSLLKKNKIQKKSKCYKKI
jgi:hypothetical protein